MMAATTRKAQGAAATAITNSILSILAALDGLHADTLACVAYVVALRRRGEDLVAVGGVEALREARDAAMAEAPDQAKPRAALLDAAWTTIPGWTV